ncbi:MAG: hypothetical protein JXB35_12975 [Anaerolineae bacterium]|nr:hypothetical protein [Anaerolineae bacterium]
MTDPDLAHLLATWPDPGPGNLAPRERVRMALERREPDRVPVDLWAVPEVWTRLTREFGGISQEAVLKRLRVDVRWVRPTYVGPERTRPGGVEVDAFGAWRKVVFHDFGSYNEYAGYPLAEAQTAADVHAWDWSRTEYWDVGNLPGDLARLNEDDDYFICYDVGGIFERSWGLRGLDRFLIDLVEQPDIACAIMDRMTDLYIANVTRVLEAGGGRINMAYTWDDVAHQHGLMISPRMWRKFMAPRHQRLNAAIRAADPHVKIMYHSCGAIAPLIPSLLDDLGIDVLNPLQPQARGMDPARLKADFGDRLAFHGGVDLQYTLPHGNPDEVRAEVRRLIDTLGVGGGYVLAAAHYIQNDVPTQNILAMYGVDRRVARRYTP